MLENTSTMDKTGGSSDELLKVVIDKIMDSGTAIREIREQVRRLMVQNEIVGELDQRIDKQEMHLTSIIKALSVNQDKTGKALEHYHAALGNQINSLKDKLNPDKLIDTMGDLQGGLRKHIKYFEEPGVKEIHYRHIIGNSAIVVIAEFLAIVILLFFLIKG